MDGSICARVFNLVVSLVVDALRHFGGRGCSCLYGIEDARGIVLVTCEHKKEFKAKLEALDCIFHLDPDAVGIITRYPGLVLIMSAKLSSRDMFLALKDCEMAYVKRVIPLERFLIARDLQDICRLVDELVKPHVSSVKSFKVVCSKRGSFFKSAHEIEVLLGSYISRSFGLCIDLKSPELLVDVEVVDNLVGVTVFPQEVLRKSS